MSDIRLWLPYLPIGKVAYIVPVVQPLAKGHKLYILGLLGLLLLRFPVSLNSAHPQ